MNNPGEIPDAKLLQPLPPNLGGLSGGHSSHKKSHSGSSRSRKKSVANTVKSEKNIVKNLANVSHSPLNITSQFDNN